MIANSIQRTKKICTIEIDRTSLLLGVSTILAADNIFLNNIREIIKCSTPTTNTNILIASIISGAIIVLRFI
jgi:hypothetical protein